MLAVPTADHNGPKKNENEMQNRLYLLLLLGAGDGPRLRV
jgi:hypothetical protein